MSGLVCSVILLLAVNCCLCSDSESAEYSIDDSLESESNELYDADKVMTQPTHRVTKINFHKTISGENTTHISRLNFTQANYSKAVPTRSHKELINDSSHTLVNYPYSVSIQKKGAHYATGALIDKRWIITVAGELYNVRESLKLYKARLGSVDCKKGGVVVPIKRIEIHPAYVFGSPNFDVALLGIGHPVEYTDNIRPIALANIKNNIISGKFQTNFWSRVIVNGQVRPAAAVERVHKSSMRVVNQQMIPWDKCKELLMEHNQTLDVSSMCLKPSTQHHSTKCSPDPGAAVVGSEGLYGVMSSWSPKNCNGNHKMADIIARLSWPSVRSWLDVQLLKY